MIAIILPSRGLMFSRTADEILQNVKGIPHKFFFAHRQPIPDCFENPTQAALSHDNVTHLWFVEDDMILPPDTLTRLLRADKAVITCDYPVNASGRGAVFKVKHTVLFCGTGCTLVKREVFEELKEPYFRTDMKWNIKNMGGNQVKLTRSQDTSLDGYGLHDVNFGLSLYKVGIPIHVLGKKLGQRKLIALGKQGSNDGAHQVEEWKKVQANQLFKTVKGWPIQPTGDLVEIQTPTGPILTDKAHASKLVRKGLGKRVPKQPVVVDWSEE